MQDKINSFNAAFVDLAAAYVRRMANKIAGNETYTAEPPAGPLRWGMSLADEMRVANLLAATIGKMQADSDGELPADGQYMTFRGGRVTLEPGAEINLGKPIDLENTIKKTVAETFKEWTATATESEYIVIPEEEAAEIERAVQEAGPGTIVNLEEEDAPGTASATAAWKVLQTLGYVNERPFQETQDFLKKALEILKILEQSGVKPEYWGGVFKMAATFDIHMRG